MKLSVIAILASLSLSAAAAEKDLFNCTVPSESATKVTLKITVTNDSSADFVRVKLNDGQNVLQFFSQIEKGDVDSQIKAGAMGLFLVSENTRQENGVVRNAGFMGLRKDSDKFSGFLSAQASLYPLECTLAQ